MAVLPMEGDPDGPVGRSPAGEAENDRGRLIRDLGRVAELYHTINYYSPEINKLTDDGFRGWWHAYLAYRPAPLGPVGPAVVTAAFYNFAPSFVSRAVPGVWDIMSPEAVLARRDELVGEALARIFPPGGPHAPIIDEAAELAEASTACLATGARPLTAALLELPRHDNAPMRLFASCTLLREFRGDGHNLALAAAEIDGAASHVLMAAHGHGNQPTIQGIRGWTAEEWAAAVARLAARGIVDDSGVYTDQGRRFRSGVEAHTDRLCADVVDNVGVEAITRLNELLGQLGSHLTESGEVPGVWPPPTVQR
jgi:hypothetical protein